MELGEMTTHEKHHMFYNVVSTGHRSDLAYNQFITLTQTGCDPVVISTLINPFYFNQNSSNNSIRD